METDAQDFVKKKLVGHVRSSYVMKYAGIVFSKEMKPVTTETQSMAMDVQVLALKKMAGLV